MQIHLTPAAATWLTAQSAQALTVASVVFSSCCARPLPPEVKVGLPADPAGFQPYPTDAFTLYYDTLLDGRPQLTIDLKDYGKYQELIITDWSARA